MLGQLLDGRYRIIQPLGSGGFSQTYIAEDTKLYNTQCVVKQLQPPATDSKTLQLARRLFDSEAQLLHKLGNHHQIPQLLAHFEENQEFYLIQQFIAGHPLSKELRSGKTWSENYAIALLQSILQPLAFVHENHVIHRDIKPPNLIRRYSDGEIVLIDFGAVKQIGTQVVNHQGQTQITMCIGTPGYMPSEQGRGRPRFSSDIYAVGIIGIQALTGLMPDHIPEDPHSAEMHWRHLVSVSPELADILDKMVRYDFRERYQSAAEVLAALENLVDPYVLTQQSATRTYEPIFHTSNLQTCLNFPQSSVLQQCRQAVSLLPKLIYSVKESAPVKRSQEESGFYFQWLIANVFGYAGGFFLGFGILAIAGNFAAVCFWGLAVGVKEWFVLHRKVSFPFWSWILVTTLAFVIPFYFFGLNNWQYFALLHGLIVGLGQWLVLRRLVHRSGWWVLTNVLGGWFCGLISGIVLVWLLQKPKTINKR
ncbi:protein kinase domain-containing protein [Nodularia sp. NIES-3585]|uniref:protein kinase domain-containing protein n=1 Tax=Nodularia sp. NIES-3585 TaxID=1973477 RepID=UPI000B5C3CE2|nr:protein kinase [Nodularia sp. NIES-3585]GAX37554.1 serine/threonine protein kinase [Nodularia sp. NIES-3585]